MIKIYKMEENKEDNLLPPYQRLQALFSDNRKNKMTDNVNGNLNELLNIKKREYKSWTKFKNFFIKLDGLIFRKEKYTNRFQNRK